MAAKKTRRSASRRASWTRLSDERLLELRICDLGLKLEGSPLERHITRLQRELAAKGIRFRPHCWLSDSWFAPSGITGFAIPFYLAHPRLTRLEERQMFSAEGHGTASFMRLVRHECGHAVDTAYRLHLRSSWRRTFGNYSKHYRPYYHPRPFSRDYVRHLDNWYAQSHPAEDFCETFAVWLTPRSRWSKVYEGWPALEKLKYVSALMREIRGRRPLFVCRERYQPVTSLTMTLRQYYQRKKERYHVELPDSYDRDLLKLFSTWHGKKPRERAATFLKRHRVRLRQRVEPWTGESLFTIDQVLGELIERCRKLKLYVDQAERKALEDATLMLAVQTMNYLHSGHHRRAR